MSRPLRNRQLRKGRLDFTAQDVNNLPFFRRITRTQYNNALWLLLLPGQTDSHAIPFALGKPDKSPLIKAQRHVTLYSNR